MYIGIRAKTLKKLLNTNVATTAIIIAFFNFSTFRLVHIALMSCFTKPKELQNEKHFEVGGVYMSLFSPATTPDVFVEEKASSPMVENDVDVKVEDMRGFESLFCLNKIAAAQLTINDDPMIIKESLKSTISCNNSIRCGAMIIPTEDPVIIIPFANPFFLFQ